MSWWQAPGEVEALQALTRMHIALHPEARIFNIVSSRAFGLQQAVADRMAGQDPPDLLQVNAREIQQVQQRFPGALEELDGLFDSLGLRQVVFPEVIAESMAGGHIVALPINLHRENSLIYNKAIFAAHGLVPPRTIPELIAVCKVLKAAGVVPLATAHQGWILRILFDAIAAGHMGAAAFRDYFTGVSAAGQPRVREALAIFYELVHDDANPDAGEEGFNWTNAAQTLYNGDAAMFIHGDWTRAYLSLLGWRPDVDFGVVAGPGTADLFVYVTDAFAIPNGAKNRRGAREFLAVATSPAGQAAFNRAKGSSPIRADVERRALDPLGRETLGDLERAQIRMRAPNSAALDRAFEKLIADADVDSALAVLADYARTRAAGATP
jgi:glucose/mannose transport system substrate-binding protein